MDGGGWYDICIENGFPHDVEPQSPRATDDTCNDSHNDDITTRTLVAGDVSEVPCFGPCCSRPLAQREGRGRPKKSVSLNGRVAKRQRADGHVAPIIPRVAPRRCLVAEDLACVMLAATQLAVATWGFCPGARVTEREIADALLAQLLSLPVVENEDAAAAVRRTSLGYACVCIESVLQCVGLGSQGTVQ